MNNFCSVDTWKSALMTLPDTSFFELLRTVLGKIKTPFNKQMLLGDLEKFLLRADIQKNIAAFIDQDDARIIAAVAALDNPVMDKLTMFFTGELHYAELHDRVVNLEERFIIYRFSDDHNKKQETRRLALNPVLETVLQPFIADKTLLFPSLPVSTQELPDCKSVMCNDRILAALLSFITQHTLFFFGEGRVVRRKVLAAAKTVFPGFPLELFIGGLEILGLFVQKESPAGDGILLLPDYARFADFGGLSSQNRMAYCAAGIWCYMENQQRIASPWLSRAKIRDCAAFINSLYTMLDSDRLYSLTTVRKLIGCIQCNDIRIDINNIIDIMAIMEKTGLLIKVSAEAETWRKADFKAEPLSREGNPSAKSAVAAAASIAADTPSTFIMYPEITYNDAIELAAFSAVVEAGSVVRFALTRDSLVAAFNRGLSAETVIALLRRLSLDRIDENMIFSLRDWEKRHGEISLRRALVLTLAPEQQHLAKTRLLARLITETLAPGVYLLPENMEDKALEALRKAGVAIIGQKNVDANDTISDGASRSGFLSHSFPALPSFQESALFAGAASLKNTPAQNLASALIEDFHSILNQMHIEKEAQNELAARINRRLVLCEAQLKDAFLRYEKLEARGLDYVGKAMIAKQAISQQTPLELMVPGKGKQERIFGIPKALEKANSESILVIESPVGGETAHQETMHLPLGKISQIRRIKKSIFES